MKYNWGKITDYLMNECSLETKREIDELIKNDAEFKKIIDEMRTVISFEQQPLDITDAEVKWGEIEAQLHKSSQKSNIGTKLRVKSFGMLKYAAAVILMIIGTLSYFMVENSISTIPELEYKTLVAKNGERRTIILFDGTTVNLDCGSELKYPTKFGKNREVFLKGEGFFQVATDSSRPFIVHADDTKIQVLGTKFNIRTWDDRSNDVVVTVVEGKVAFGTNNTNLKNKVLLTKNMQASLAFDGIISKPKAVNASKYSRWMHNEIYFDNATMKEIISQLERWYNLEFDISEEILEKTDLAVHINNLSINSTLDMLATLTNTKVERKGNKVSFIAREEIGDSND